MMLYNIIISLTRQLHNSSRVHFFSYRELRFSDTSFPSNSHMLKLVEKSRATQITSPSSETGYALIIKVCQRNSQNWVQNEISARPQNALCVSAFPTIQPEQNDHSLGNGICRACSSTVCSSQWTPKIMQSYFQKRYHIIYSHLVVFQHLLKWWLVDLRDLGKLTSCGVICYTYF